MDSDKGAETSPKMTVRNRFPSWDAGVEVAEVRRMLAARSSPELHAEVLHVRKAAGRVVQRGDSHRGRKKENEREVGGQERL